MTVTFETRDGKCVASIRGDFTIYMASETKGKLAEWLSTTTSGELDLTGVREFDSAGLQVLLWLKGEAHAQGKTVHLVAQSEAVREVVELLRVGNEIQTEVAAAG